MSGRIGILALQGDYSLHADLLQGIGVDVALIRRAMEFAHIDALVLPGGESTTLRRMMRINELDDAFLEFSRSHPVFGTCAGCILMASRLENDGGVQPYGLLDMTVVRNGFGRQVDSFESPLELSGEIASRHADHGLTGVFIRAPRISSCGAELEILARHEGEIVAVRGGHHLAITFHPEVAADDAWHRFWLEQAKLLG